MADKRFKKCDLKAIQLSPNPLFRNYNHLSKEVKEDVILYRYFKVMCLFFVVHPPTLTNRTMYVIDIAVVSTNRTIKVTSNLEKRFFPI